MDVIIPIAVFGFIALSSREIGNRFKKARLPLITGYLIAGILAGQFVLGLLSHEMVSKLLWIDEVSLAFIAFAAGSELNISDLKSKVRSLTWLTVGVSILTFAFGTAVFYWMSSTISILASLGDFERLAISMMMASILIARSPSSAIAIIQELRAKGPFTQITLGVTVISDVVVIFVFALTASIADAAFEGISISILFVVILLFEIILNLIFGFVVSQIIKVIYSFKIPALVKTVLTLSSGYAVYWFSHWFKHFSAETWGHELLIEPLLVCMVASFIVVNYTKHRNEFLNILHDTGPFVYIVFFTLTGAELELDTLLATWSIALALFGARLAGIFLGSWGGGKIAGDPPEHNRMYWMAFLTQAGVGLGLAKDVAVEFPDLGNTFATIAIAVIVINQIIGPPFHKIATRKVGESHEKAEAQEFDGVRDALIFGLEDQSMALARELLAHDWQVKIATLNGNSGSAQSPAEGAHTMQWRRLMAMRQNLSDESDLPQTEGVEILVINELSLEELKKLNIEKTDTVVGMLTDEENYCLVDCIYENFGVKNVVVRVNDRAEIEKFHQLDALTVHPSTAMVNLLEHFVRSPNAVSILLGSEVEQDREVIEITVTNPGVHNLLIRDLRLPLDVLLLQIERKGETLISQGYTRIKYGDRLSVLGSQESLQEVIRLFES
ncbi:cation:proton antiporter [bacterium]|nr:cation:proton antiporter [bacterium]